MQKVANEQRIAFANSILEQFNETPAFKLPKGELDLAIFRAYVNSGIVSLSATDFSLALELGSTPTKVASLRYRMRLDAASNPMLWRDLARHVLLKGFESDGQLLVVSVEEKFFRDLLLSELRKINSFVDGSFKASVLKIDADALVSVVENLGSGDAEALGSAISKFKRGRKSSNAATVFKDFISASAAGVTSSLLSQVLGIN